jgi:hypothetical protein
MLTKDKTKGRRRAVFKVLGAVCILLFTGCAGVTYETITSEAMDTTARGLRYYDSSPYLLVQTDNQGSLKAELIYLPDLTKKRQATPYAFLATNTTSLDFQKGVVTTTISDVDTSAVPVSVVNALKGISVEALKLFDDSDPNGPAPPDRVPRVYLFKIVKRDYIDPKDVVAKRDWGLIGASGGEIAYKKQ